MSDFIRLSATAINMNHVREINFPGDGVVIHWDNGQTKLLTGVDVGLFLLGLEKRDDLMTDPGALFWNVEQEDEEAIAETA